MKVALHSNWYDYKTEHGRCLYKQKRIFYRLCRDPWNLGHINTKHCPICGNTDDHDYEDMYRVLRKVKRNESTSI